MVLGQWFPTTGAARSRINTFRVEKFSEVNDQAPRLFQGQSDEHIHCIFESTQSLQGLVFEIPPPSRSSSSAASKSCSLGLSFSGSASFASHESSPGYTYTGSLKRPILKQTSRTFKSPFRRVCALFRSTSGFFSPQSDASTTISNVFSPIMTGRDSE